MKFFFIFFIIFFLNNCTKPKTVLICGDHKCVNKAEANQYFEENLTLEVRVLEKKKSESFNLVKLNTEKEEKKIKVIKKKNTNKKMKKLSENEKKKILKDIKTKKKAKLNKKKINNETKKNKNEILKETDSSKVFQTSKNIKKTTSKNSEIIDICTLLEKCEIEEISKYLIKKGKDKKFPDISLKE